MQNEEIAEALTGSLEQLQEELEYAEIMVTKKPTFPHQANAPRFLERKQQWREYRDQLLTEIASRA
jgi:hypothetical protein